MIGRFDAATGNCIERKTRGLELINLATDESETKNLAESEREKVQELSKAYDKWIATMAAPITGGSKGKAKPSAAKLESSGLTAREIERQRFASNDGSERLKAKKAAK